MPIPSGFKEKEYEGLLYPALSASPLVWTPDQVLEEHVGIDAALTCVTAYWQVVHRPPAPGLVLAHFGLFPILPKAQQKETLPDFSTNLFVQAKRTWEYKRRPPEAVTDEIGPPCRYFDIDEDQRDKLCELAAHLGAAAEVTYACANLMTKQDLFKHAKAGDLVQKSTFPTAYSLAGHGRWLFDSPGAKGTGLSEPERIELPPLLERLERLASYERQVDGNPDLERQLSVIWHGLLATWGEAHSYRWVFDLAGEIQTGGLAGLAAQIRVVLEVLGIGWLVVGRMVTSP
ncbi:MAG: hypothetical protein RLO52_42795 [Sandaracinaceae bacterium]